MTQMSPDRNNTVSDSNGLQNWIKKENKTQESD